MHTNETMDKAAKLLGAPDHQEFLKYAPRSMYGAFKLICLWKMKN
jgi:hypothetical protein